VARQLDLTLRDGRRRPRLLLLGAVGLLLVYAIAFQGSRGLWEPDEGRYVDVALEMVRLGDFVTPHLHHQMTHLTKPPLTYWALAGGMGLLGRNEWGARLPHALAFVGTVLLVWVMARRLVPERPELPPVVYATMLLPFVAANIVTTDTLLTFWVTAAAAAFVAGWWGGERERRRRCALMWLAFGAAFLTKGPVGLLPLAGMLAVAAAEGRGGLRDLLCWRGAARFVLVGLGWYCVVIAREPKLVGYFVGGEIVERALSATYDRNAQWYGAFKVYLPTLILGLMPWTWVLARRWRAGLAWLAPSRWRQAAREDSVGLFLTAWVVVPLVMFFLVRSRLHLYLLPLFPALALLVGRELAPRWRWSRKVLVALGLWCICLIGLKAGFAAVRVDRDARRQAQAIAALADVARYDEVVVVGLDEGLGLALYLDLEVEFVAATEHEWLYDRHPYWTSTLLAELEDPERRLFLVSSRRFQRFADIVAERGLEPRRFGTVGRAEVVELAPRPAQLSGGST